MNRRIVVYISSPYTLGDTADNVRRQMDAYDKLLDCGYCPIAPLHGHYQQIYRPKPYDVWMEIDLTLVSISDVVLRIGGESSGADIECKHAASKGIPVVYSIPELLDYPIDIDG